MHIDSLRVISDHSVFISWVYQQLHCCDTGRRSEWAQSCLTSSAWSVFFEYGLDLNHSQTRRITVASLNVPMYLVGQKASTSDDHLCSSIAGSLTASSLLHPTFCPTLSYRSSTSPFLLPLHSNIISPPPVIIETGLPEEHVRLCTHERRLRDLLRVHAS